MPCNFSKKHEVGPSLVTFDFQFVWMGNNFVIPYNINKIIKHINRTIDLFDDVHIAHRYLNASNHLDQYKKLFTESDEINL